MVRQDRKRSCWIYPINLLRAPLRAIAGCSADKLGSVRAVSSLPKAVSVTCLVVRSKRRNPSWRFSPRMIRLNREGVIRRSSETDILLCRHPLCDRCATPPNSLSTHLSWPSATLGGAFEETPEVRSSRSLSSKIFVAGQSFIVKE
jgi:hypothetical protein